MNTSILVNTPVNVLDNFKKSQEISNLQLNNSVTMNAEVKKEVEDSLLIERQKKERLAVSKAQKSKDLSQGFKTNEVIYL